MRYTLIHCYTDKNAGDAAIIIGTIQLLRRVDPQAHVSLISTYGVADERFPAEHAETAVYADALYPSVFPQPLGESNAARGWDFLRNGVRAALAMADRQQRLFAPFARDAELAGVRAITEANLVISKGGSFLTSQNKGLRQALSLLTMAYPILLARRLGKPVVVFGQSLGPVEGALSKRLFRATLNAVDRVFLRERECYDRYDIVRETCEGKVDFMADAAFAFTPKALEEYLPEAKGPRLGITIVDHAFKNVRDPASVAKRRRNYSACIVAMLERALEEHGADVHIFVQVHVGNSHHGHNDARASRDIYERLVARYGNRIKLHLEQVGPSALAKRYGQMDAMVGTRLHSTILALAQGVPCLNISYHGTKSLGIFRDYFRMDYNVLDIDHIEVGEAIAAVDKLLTEREEMAAHIRASLKKVEASLEDGTRRLVLMAAGKDGVDAG